MFNTIALVNMCFPKEIDVLAPPLGLLSIATVLDENGIKSKLYDTALDIKYSDFTLDNLSNYLINIPENIIGISTWDSIFPKVVLATKFLKEKYPNKKIILGGPTISNLNYKVIEKFSWIDYCVSGEGEYPFTALIKYLVNGLPPDFLKLPSSIYSKKGNNIIQGNQVQKNGNLLTIPILNYSLIDNSKYNRIEISTSRGCPYSCEFCSVNSTLDNTLRFRPLVDIFKEIDLIFSFSNIDCINIVDDNFGLNKSRLVDFCKTFKLKYPKKNWTCYFRLDDLTPDTVDMMFDSKCIGAFIGIEAGNSNKLKSLGKYLAYDDILGKIEYATSKIDITASFIWGFPDESEEQLLDTFELINRLADFDSIIIDLYQLSPLTGTKIQKILSSHLTFDNDVISGFVFPPYLPPLNEMEKKLIEEIPEFFSAFYHEDNSLFGNKYYMVKKFFEEIKN